MMDITRLWSCFKAFVPLSRTSNLNSFQPRERFHDIIRREQVRADRNQHPFSLLVFYVGNQEANGTHTEHLAHIVTNRVRLTDEVGWFDNQRIGILLPDTSTDGAQRLADDICQTYNVKISPPEYVVYTYPFKWFSNGNGHQTQLHFADLSSNWKTTISRGFSVTPAPRDGRNIIFGTQSPSIDATSNCETLSQEIEPFSLNPLPVWKRAMDILCALLGLVVLSPILLITALFIKIVSPGPVFFRQQRVGYLGKKFTMLKFRTMKPDADSSAHQQHMSRLIKSANGGGLDRPMTKVDNKSQIVHLGNILRKTCIDELPQLFNVLRGEMSLVGPRPPIPYEVEEYSPWHYGRFNTVPGVTGLWQVSGKNQLTFLEMVRLDIRYLRKITLLSDIIILLKTPLAIISEIKDSLPLQKKELLVRRIVENA